MGDIFILEGARTPFAAWAGGARGDGRKGGALRPFDPFDLGAAALKGALAKSGLNPGEVGKLIFGNMYQVGSHACYGARYVSHRAGLPARTPCLAVNLACGTGLQALISAASEIELGRADIVAAAGADNVSLVRRDVFIPSFTDISCGLPIALAAQNSARGAGLSRQQQDRWALISHQRANSARGRGVFAEEIAAVGDVKADDAALPDPRPEFFAGSKSLFENGDATHANTHAIVDGGAALILASGKAAAGRNPLGRYLSGIVIGLPAEKMAFASVDAIGRLLKQINLGIGDIDLFEINETFASQMLIDMKELGIPEEKINVNGGALALGHPFAATGLRLALTLLYELRRRNLKRGIASICIGGGLGVAVAVERI